MAGSGKRSSVSPTCIGLAAGLILLAAVYVSVGQWLAETGGLEKLNALFGADVPRVIGDLTSPNANHYRTAVHPLFVLLFNPLGSTLAGLLGNVTASIVLTSLAGAVSVVLFFILTRRLGARPLGAALLATLYASTASHVIWSCVPETWVFGAATLLLVHLVGLASHGGIARVRLWLPAAGLLALAVTTTNYVQYLIVLLTSLLGGTAATKGVRPALRGMIRPAMVLSVAPIVVAMGLAAVQRAIYPSSALFFHHRSLLREMLWVSLGSEPLAAVLGDATRGHVTLGAKLVAAISALVSEDLSFRQVLSGLAYNAGMSASSFLAWALIAPAPYVRELYDGTRSISFLPSSWASYSVTDFVTVVVIWVGVLLGARLLWLSRRPAFWQLSGSLWFNLVLHLFYGANESFLYTPHGLFALIAFLAPCMAQAESGSTCRRVLVYGVLGIVIAIVATRTVALLWSIRILVEKI